MFSNKKCTSTTMGKIVNRIIVKNGVSLTVEYMVNGNPYIKTLWKVFPSNYAKDQLVRIKYDPNNPANSFIDE